MYYIEATPRESGDYGNPMGQVFPGCVALPDELLGPYIEAKGFVFLELERAEEVPIPLLLKGIREFYVVTAVEVNREALDAYHAEHPDIPEPTPEEELDVWDELANAIREGVDSV